MGDQVKCAGRYCECGEIKQKAERGKQELLIESGVPAFLFSQESEQLHL